MSEDKLTVVPFPAAGKKHEDAACGGSRIPPPPPGSHLTTTGRRLYSWICEALIADGRKIDAAGMQIVMIVHTFLAWSDDLKLCLELKRYAVSENGNRFELPHSYNERNARQEIKRELPEACMTVMSQIEARLKESKTKGGGYQDDLFGDLVEHGQSRPSLSA